MRRLPPLAALRAFEAAARRLSFKLAAEELGVTPTAISHQVRLLEDILGQPLFERRTRQVLLTAEGRRLYPVLREGFDAMAEAWAALKAEAAAPAVTVTATLSFTSRWLVPRVAAFRAAHPQVELRVLASNSPVDVAGGAADLAVRYGQGRYPGCRSERLFESRFAPVCAPGLGLRAPADLAGQTLIRFDWAHPEPDTPLWPLWFEAAGIAPRSAGELAFSDETHALQAALEGQGVVLCNLALVADELASGVLTVPFGPFLPGRPFWLVAPERGRPGTQAAVAAARAWLLEEAAAFQARLAHLEGAGPRA